MASLFRSAVFLTAVTSALMTSSVRAADEVKTLKFSYPWALKHFQWEEGGGYWGKLVEQASGGKIKVVAFPSNQLGKDQTAVIGAGLAETGIAAPSYEPDKLPLSSVAELPGMASTACEGSAKLWALLQPGKILYEKEFKPLGLHPLYANVLAPFELMTNKKKITTLDEVKGIKIRANGSAMDKAARAIGAVPVQVTSNEFYDSLKRGTIDGGLWNNVSTKQVGLTGVLNYTVHGTQLGTALTVHVMNLKTWEGLDNASKKIVTDAAMKTQIHLCEYLDKSNVASTQELVKEGLQQVVTLSAAEQERWLKAVSGVGDQWAKEVNAAGHDGSGVVKAFRAAPSKF
jgi:TRAP-type C4-dicarboxylate transport system substrate-binding protein